MATELKLRKGTTAQHATFIGAVAEVTVDTDKDTLVVHDGITAGGFPLARALDTASSLQTSDIGVTVQGYDADTTKNDVSNTFTANQVISVTDNTNAALRITQTGTGNALVVEDSTNPDSTPIVVDQAGLMVLGSPTNQAANLATGNAKLQIVGGTAPLAFFRDADSSTAINLEFAKRRATGGVLQSGDTIGRLYFSGNDGAAAIPAAFIDAVVDGTPGTNDMPGRLVFSTTADGASTPTEKLRIASTGAIGLSGANYGTSGQVLTSAGSNAAPTWQDQLSLGLSLGAAVATTSGTAFDFTGISSTAKRITLTLSGVSLSGTDGVIVRIGDSGGLETTGYLGNFIQFYDGGPVNGGALSTAIQLVGSNGASGSSYQGVLVLNLLGSSTNTWAFSGTVSPSTTGSTARTIVVSGSKALSATLDRLTVTRTGTNTFDAGIINILVEG